MKSKRTTLSRTKFSCWSVFPWPKADSHTDKSKLLILSLSVSYRRRNNISTWWRVRQCCRIQSMTEILLIDSDNDKSWTFINSIVKAGWTVLTMPEGAFGSLPWPTGLPALATYLKCVLRMEAMSSSSKAACEWHVGQHESIKFPADVTTTSLAFNNFTVIRLDLTKKLLQSMKGFDYPIKKAVNDKCRLSTTFGNFTVQRSGLTKK